MIAIQHKARVALIRTGKVLPFIICSLVCVSYIENLIAILFNLYVYCDGYAIPYKPISWFLGEWFEYNVQVVVIVSIISIAIGTCIYNKLACAYLWLNLIQKELFADIVLDEATCCCIIVVNIVIAGTITCKGLAKIKKSC